MLGEPWLHSVNAKAKCDAVTGKGHPVVPMAGSQCVPVWYPALGLTLALALQGLTLRCLFPYVHSHGASLHTAWDTYPQHMILSAVGVF